MCLHDNSKLENDMIFAVLYLYMHDLFEVLYDVVLSYYTFIMP